MFLRAHHRQSDTHGAQAQPQPRSLAPGSAPVLRVQVHLQQLGAVRQVAGALAHNLGRVDQVLQQGGVDCGEGAGAGARNGCAGGGLGHDAPVGHDHYVLAAKLLLQLAHQARLHLVEALEQPEGNVDHDSLAARRDVNLLGAVDEQIAQVHLQLCTAEATRQRRRSAASPQVRVSSRSASSLAPLLVASRSNSACATDSSNSSACAWDTRPSARRALKKAASLPCGALRGRA